MKAREIIILFLIIIAGVSFYYIYTGKVHIGFDNVEGLLFTIREKFTFEESQVIEPPFPDVLKVVNSHGNIEVIGSEEKTATIFFQKEVWRKNEKQAADVSEKVQILIDRDGDQITVSTNREEFEKQNLKTHFRIYVPQEMNVEVENSYGLVSISNVRKTSIKNPYGKVIASDIEGTLSIHNSYKEVEVENVLANVELKSKYSSVLLKNIQGDVTINHSYGKIELENISQKVEIESPYTEVYGQDLRGHIEVKSTYRKISLFDIGPATVAGYHSAIEIERAKGNLQITNSYGKARLTQVEGNLRVEGKDLEVNGRGIVGDEILISTSYKDTDLTESSGKMTISISHGNLTLSPSSVTHPLHITGEYADITFFWPRGEKYPFEARAKNGEINWKLPAEISSWEDEQTTVLRAFLGEKEQPFVYISTTYGNILVEEY